MAVVSENTIRTRGASFAPPPFAVYPGRLRVAFVAPSLRILGGQAVQADRLLHAWQSDPEVAAWLVPVNPVPPPPFAALTRIKYVRTIVTELTYGPLLFRELARADVIHVFSAAYTSFLLAPLPAVLVARVLGKPVVLNYRSGEGPDHLRRSPVARTALAHVQRTVVPSRFLVDAFGRFGLDAAIVPNIVDLERFRFRDRPTFGPRLVSTRNFESLYNVACTLRAFRLVQDRHPDATLTLVGGGSQDAPLRRLASELGVTGVAFTGRVRPDDIAQHYAANDIYIQTPNIDNMPTSVIEAFACGLPVVSTEAGGVPAIVTDGRNGLLAPIGDHETIARHVLTVVDRPEMARALATRGFETAAACTWPVVRQQWIDVYRSVLHQPARDAAPSPTHAG